MTSATVSYTANPGGIEPQGLAKLIELDQMMYRNLATNPNIAGKAVSVVQTVVKDWLDNTDRLRRRWRKIYFMLAGNSLEKRSPEDIHVPELATIVETMIPRIVEAIKQHDPWFSVFGRDHLDDAEAEALAGLFDYLLDQSGTDELVEPNVRNAVVTQFAMSKVWWRRSTCERVKRTVDKQIDEATGKTKYHITAKVVEEVDYNGIEHALIDPYDAIIDTSKTSAQRMLYVGDRQRMHKSNILAMGEQLGWQNLDKLSPGASGNQVDSRLGDNDKYSRDPGRPWTETLNRSQLTEDTEHEVVCIYVRTALEPDRKIRDYEIVLVDGSIPMVVRRNTHDGQIRPYAINRVPRNGHSFFGTGVIDNSVRMNQYLDRLNAMALKAAEFGALPVGFAEQRSDLPDSLFKVSPGQMYSGVGNVRFMPVSEGSYRGCLELMNYTSRKIEEATGISKLQQGQDLTGGTATESTIALQEANRRLRSQIRSFGDWMKQVLVITANLARQCLDDKTTYRVLGKRASMLKSNYMSVEPDLLQHDIDFEIVGLRSLNSYGVRGAALQALGNLGMPIIAANPDRIDQVGFFYEVTSEMVGRDMADRFIRMPQKPELVVPADQENAMLLSGTEIEIHELDDHKDHAKQHLPLFNAVRRGFIKGPAAVAIARHMLAHGQALEVQEARNRQMQQRQMAAPAEAGGDAGESGQSPVAGGFSPQMGGSKPAGQSGQNPGPPDEQKIRRPGRGQAASAQSEQQYV